MMKKFIVASLLMPLCFNAQSVGINTDKPNRSAALHIAPFKGEMAKITANISGGRVTGFNIINPGSGYTQAPEVFIAGGGASVKFGGRRATATATVKDGKITSINLVDGGNGYVADPSVTLMRPNDNLGWLMPRVNLESITNGTTPVNITDNGGDGVLVYNESNNGMSNTTYWWDTDGKQWKEGITADRTPRMNLYSFTQDTNVTGLVHAGNRDFKGAILHMPFREAISNLSGVEFKAEPPLQEVEGLGRVDRVGGHYLSLPKIPATYIIEVSLNFTTEKRATDYDFNSPNTCSALCSKPFTSDGYHIMGYYLEARYYQYRDSDHEIYSTKLIAPRPGIDSKANRKEIPVIAKIGDVHTATWNFVVEVDPDYAANDKVTPPFIRFILGRMDGSTYYNNPTILKEGSFIKVQQVR